MVGYPPAPDLIMFYANWKDAYKKYLSSYHNYLEIVGHSSTHNDPATFAIKERAVITNPDIQQAENQKQIDYKACLSCEIELIERFNQWLKSLESKDLNSSESLSIVEKLRHHLGQSKDVAHRILVQSNAPDLRKMPWTKWSLLKDFSRTEIGLIQPKFEKRDIKVKRQINQIRILAILGKQANIQGEIEKLAQTNIEIKIVTNLAELNEPLWRESWDIIIFNGHSKTEHGTTGEFVLSDTEKLTISNLRGHFNQAIERGLKLVIFNSCDGLGLAHQLGEGEKLYLSQVIVMRELLPTPVAPIFLRYLFEEFSKGVSLYEAMRLTKDKLLPLEKTQYPGISALPVICQNPAANPLHWFDLVIPPNPYQGLSAFQEKNAALFFGRETFTHQLVKVVETKKLVAVIGASGSGKSSVVLAGLIPSLRQQENWLMASLRPGATPFENLAKALLSPVVQLETGESEGVTEVNVDEINQLAIDLQEGNRTLSDVVKSIGSSRRFLLVVDQFEEIYTYPNQKIRQFLDCLLDAVQDFSAFRLVITLRADFLGQAIEYNPFREQLDRWKPEFIGGMERHQLQAAIEEPAKKRNVYLEAGLTEHILNDVGEEPGNLPLLEFALTELWKQQENGLLNLRKYDEIGGVEKALCRHAEGVYDGLKEGDKKRTKQIFMRLVSPGEGTEYTRQLATRAEVGEENWDLVTRLATARLVVSNRSEVTEIETVEIVHEALIKAWPDLRKWIEEDDAFLRWKKRLQAALREWERNENKEGYLLQGAPLGEAEGYLLQRLEDISKAEREFIQLGLGLRDRNRRRTIAGLASGLAAVSIFAVGAVWQSQRAERQSLINEVDSLSNLALNQFQSGSGEINALLSAMEAGQKLKQLVKEGEPLANYPTTRPLLALQTINGNIREKNVLKNSADISFISKAIFTPDGKQIVSLNATNPINNRKIIIWNLSGEKVTEWDVDQDIYNFAISPNGKYIAAISLSSLYLMDFSGKKIAQHIAQKYSFDLPGIDENFADVKFSPDSQYVALKTNAISYRGMQVVPFPKIEILNLSLKKVSNLIVSHQKDKFSDFDFDFMKNSQEIIIGNYKGVVEYWNFKTFKKNKEFNAHNGGIQRAIVSPDGHKILTLGIDTNFSNQSFYMAKLWDSSGKNIANFRLQNFDNFHYHIRFSPDSQQIAIAIKGIKEIEPSNQEIFQPGTGIVRLYDANSGALTDTLRVSGLLYTNVLFSGEGLTYSQDGKTVAMVGHEGILLLDVAKRNLDLTELPKNYEKEHIFGYQGKASTIEDFKYSYDSQKILIAYEADRSEKLDIWDLQKKQVKTLDGNHTNASTRIYINSDGQSFNIVNDEGIRQFDLNNQLNYEFKINADTADTIDTVNQEDLFFMRLPLVFPDGRNRVYSSSFDGNKIATIGHKIATISEADDFPVRLWNLSTNKVNKLSHPYLFQTANVVISPNGQYLLTLSIDGGPVRLWDTDGNLVHPSLDVNLKSSSPEKVEFSGVAIILNDANRIVDIWQNSNAIKAGLKVGDTIQSVDDEDFNGDSDRDHIYSLLKGQPGTSVKITLKSRDGKIEDKTIIREEISFDQSMALSNGSGNFAKFSPDSQYFATWYVYDKKVNIKNIKNNKIINITAETPITKVYFSPDSKLIATSGSGYVVQIWDVSGNLVSKINLDKSKDTLTFSPDSQQIAVLSDMPNELTVWTLAGQEIAKFTIPEPNQYKTVYESKLVFSPDGKYIAIGTNKIMIWRYQNLNDLLSTGCDWLQEYFVTHPQEKERLKVCQYHPKSK